MSKTQNFGSSIPDSGFGSAELIIAEKCRYSLDDFRTQLNNNVLVAGGSGTGKTRSVVIPNLMQAAGSYLAVDPKGNLYRQFAEYLRARGYNVQVVDFVHPAESAHYNPLEVIRSTQDIMKMASVLVNENPGNPTDRYWDAISLSLVGALIGYMRETGYQPCNFTGMLELIREGERPNDDSKYSLLAARFEALRRENPESWSCRQFEDVNQAPTKTYDCIRSTLTSKLSEFDSEEVRIMMQCSDIDFTAIGTEKTALFVIVSDSDRSMDHLVNIFITQAMNALCEYADYSCPDSRLPVPVRFILDDFATNCRIAEFPRMISSIRSRGISVMLMVQSEAQLEQSYGHDARTVIANCDTYLYLGGNDPDTARSISLRSNRPLPQILSMPIGKCWVFRRGEQPVYTSRVDPQEYVLGLERAENTLEEIAI